MNPSYLVSLALLAGCSVPDVTFIKPGGDAGAGGGGGDAGGGGGGPGQEVEVQWFLRHLATNTQVNCPAASDIARVTTTPWNPATQQPIGTPLRDDFNCTDGSGLYNLPDGFNLISVAILSPTKLLIATSSTEIIDTNAGDDIAAATVFDDAGHITLSWDVLNKATQARVSCASAGLSGPDTIDVAGQDLADVTKVFDDRYFCDDHFGTSRPLFPAHYTLTIHALRGGSAIGDPVVLGDVQVMASAVTEVPDLQLKVPLP